MQFRKESRGDINLVGFSAIGQLKELNDKIKSHLDEILKRKDEINNAIEPEKVVCVCVQTEKENGDYKYVTGIEVSDFSGVAVDMRMEIVSEAHYAVFELNIENDLSERYLTVKKFVSENRLKWQGFWLEFQKENSFEIWVGLE